MPFGTATRLLSGHIVVKCEHCSSEGISPATKTTRRSTPENDEKLAEHQARIKATLDSHNRSMSVITAAARQGKNVDKDIAQLAGVTNGTLKALHDAAPKDAAVRIVDVCPWCDNPIDAEVQDAPAEPEPAAAESPPAKSLPGKLVDKALGRSKTRG